MVYEFSIEEPRKVIIPVTAKNPDMAQKIFQEWYEKHSDDEMIDEMLENAYNGRIIRRSEGMDVNDYWRIHGHHDFPIQLPEEAEEPQPPKYHLHVRFADGGRVDYPEIDINCIATILYNFGLNFYLYPDTDAFPIGIKGEKMVNIYAARKDKEATHYEFTKKEDLYFNEKEKRE